MQFSGVGPPTRKDQRLAVRRPDVSRLRPRDEVLQFLPVESQDDGSKIAVLDARHDQASTVGAEDRMLIDRSQRDLRRLFDRPKAVVFKRVERDRDAPAL